MSHVKVLLKALGYAKADSANLADIGDVRALVIWLENTKIRKYKIEDRKALSTLDSPQWEATFKQYLDACECPLTPGTDPSAVVLQWLLRYAVSLEYTDNAERLNKLADRVRPDLSPAEKRKRAEVVYTDLQEPEVQQALQQLLQKLQVEQPSASLLEQLQVARDLVADQLLPALQDSQLSSAARETAEHLSHLDTQKFPLGFGTGDAKLDTAATILRMLYIKELRALQSLVDQTIVEVQEFTANPRTDAALGRIGR